MNWIQEMKERKPNRKKETKKQGNYRSICKRKHAGNVKVTASLSMYQLN